MQPTGAVLSHHKKHSNSAWEGRIAKRSKQWRSRRMLHESVVDWNCVGARAAGQKTSAETFIAAGTFTLKVFRPMRTRVCICTMLLAFCHVRTNAQALAMRHPPGQSGIHLILFAAAEIQSGTPATSSQNSTASASDAASTSGTNLPNAPQPATENLPIAEPIQHRPSESRSPSARVIRNAAAKCTTWKAGWKSITRTT